MLLQIFLDGFLGFADVDGEKNEALGAKFLTDFVHEGGFVSAKAAPGGPEFEESHFAFDGVVREFLACGGCGGKVRSGFFVLGAGGKTESAEEQCSGECTAEENDSNAHAGKLAQKTEVGG